ncbi:MAG: ArsA family ATPase [Candidatus Aenigmarchaeota archaeon]|nr:ArsA family ATPase [Candidatus Aenigmarchaeota archaeon]
MSLKNPLKRETEYHFFSGKGGVGKTSLAAAAALDFSKKGRKTLLISVDPAHSLSDSFETKIGGEIKELQKNLFAVEIDPAKAVEEYKEVLTPQLEKMSALKSLGLEDTFDIAGMTPGIDEIAAFDKFLRYMHQKEWDIIVFDTAPTGHALRFLSLPDVLDSWVGKIIKMKMQFSGMINIFKKVLPFGDSEEDVGGAQLEAMKERIEEAKKILSNPKRTRYTIVLNPETMSILESERSLSVLREYHIPVSTVIVNQILPENPGCGFCTEKRALQLKKIEIIKEKFSKFKILQAPLFRQEVKGIEMLEKLSKQLSPS